MPPAGTFFESLGGAYTLTIEFPPACAATSELSVPRRYPVRLSVSGNAAHAGIFIAGGGYTEETVGGNLYPRIRDGALLSWNNFDPVCDGVPEPLSGGRTLMVCGDGEVLYNATTIVGEIAGTVSVTADGKSQVVCRGTHRFTFERVTPQA